MTTSNFKSFALAIAVLFTFALTGCEKNEIANLTPNDLDEVKRTQVNIDPHELIEDESAIDKPYNGLDKPYHEFTDNTSDDSHASTTKPPGPVLTDIERENIGPMHTGDVKRTILNEDTFSDETVPSKPVKPSPSFTDNQLKVRQLNVIDGDVLDNNVILVDRDGYPIK